MSSQPRTLFEKIWDRHVVADYGGGFALMHVDRLIVPDLSSRSLNRLRERGIALARPELVFGVADHAITTDPNSADPHGLANPLIANLREQAKHFGLTMLEVGEPGHGIMHVISPELGIALPGLTLCCSDSHSCTIGALGVLAWGIGGGELTHILATQTSVQRKPKTMRITLHGRLPAGTHGKDLILRLIGEVGVAAGNGYAVEYAGSAIRTLPMEGRFTVCNMSVEFGARFGMIAPDDTTLAYVAGRPYAPQGALLDAAAMGDWRGLASDPDARFDQDITIDMTGLTPQVTWGNNPAAVLPIDGRIPDPSQETDPVRRKEMEAALAYMDLTPGRAIEGTPIDWVFIGSCTNSRISDLRAAAAVVNAARRPRMCAPGSCRDRPGSSGKPRPRGWIKSSVTPVLNGASPVAPCVSAPTATSCHAASAACRPRTAILSAARARAAAPTWQALSSLQHRPARARSLIHAN